MTLPASGAISFNAINVELGVAGATSANINQASYRTLAGVPSGTISLASFYGKANQFSFTISANQANANLRTLAVAAGWGGSSAVVATINSGIYVYSTSTGTPGLTIDGSWPGGISLTNNGFIMGMGGAGAATSPGSPGGNAISLGTNASIINNSYIGGGGGGGTGTQIGYGNNGGGGGGAGGGAGASVTSSPGGAGGGIGAAGATAVGRSYVSGKSTYYVSGGGGGGRVFPGVGGTVTPYFIYGHGGTAGGEGGNSDYDGYSYTTAGDGGSGGGAGGNGNTGGGGGWGASGGNTNGAGTGGAGGKAIALNGYTATRSGSGTTYGVVS